MIEQQERQHQRILLTNPQRIRMAAKAKQLGRKMLEECTVLLTQVDTCKFVSVHAKKVIIYKTTRPYPISVLWTRTRTLKSLRRKMPRFRF